MVAQGRQGKGLSKNLKGKARKWNIPRVWVLTCPGLCACTGKNWEGPELSLLTSAWHWHSVKAGNEGQGGTVNCLSVEGVLHQAHRITHASPMEDWEIYWHLKIFCSIISI